MTKQAGIKTNSRIAEGQKVKILQISNYPPPVCGWAMQTKFLIEEIRCRGIVCDVLNLNENHKRKSSEYTDVQNGFDYMRKLIRFAWKGYRFQVHVNGQSKTGYMLALAAAIVGRIAGQPVALSWRGGLHQKYFPRIENPLLRWPFQLLFHLSGRISCNNMQVKQALERYGLDPDRVVAIPGFSRQHVDFQQVPLAPEVEAFLQEHHPVFFCYVSFRPEYRLPVLRDAMLRFRKHYPNAGFIWLGFPSKELPAARDFVRCWPSQERESLLVLGNLAHDEFLTLMTRCFAYIRTPACDGVSSSILESLTLGVPVVASENGNRPTSVITYREDDAEDLCIKLIGVAVSHEQVIDRTRLEDAEDNISRTVDWLLEEPKRKATEPIRDFADAD